MQIPADRKKIRALIRRYERKFEKDPHFRDGSGSRFLLGPLYLMVDDTEGALKHYRWFGEKFPDSINEPFHILSWALAFKRKGDIEHAISLLKRTHVSNAYMIPFLLETDHNQPEVKRFSNWENEDYVTEGPPEFLGLWTEEELSWLRSVWQDPSFKDLVDEHMRLVTALDLEPRGPRRSQLVTDLHNLLAKDGAPDVGKGRRDHLRVVR